MENKKNGQLMALTIGGLLILAVAFFAILMPLLKDRKNLEEDLQDARKTTEQKEASKMSPKELWQRIADREPITLVDIREPAGFDVEHIEKSINVSSDNIVSSLEKGKAYVLIDDGSAGFSRNLAAALGEAGFMNISYLDGGFSAWKKANFPTVSAGDPQSIIDVSKVTFMKFEELRDTLQNEPDNVMLVDLRNPENFAQEHLKGAINIPLGELEKRKKELSPIKKIILYDDNQGLSAFQGAVRLFDLNVFEAYSVSEGLSSLKEKGLEIGQ